MFEAKFAQGNVLRKVVDALRDLVTEAKFEFSPTGISLQSMDSGHIVLVALELRADGFESYRCDRAIPVGMKMASLSKVVKTSGADDAVTLRAEDAGGSLAIRFDAPDGGRTCEYDLRLMDLDVDSIAVPELDYDVCVKMSAAEFQRVCRDLSTLGDAVMLSVTKDCVTFTTRGDDGTGTIQVRGGAQEKKDGPATEIVVRTPHQVYLCLNFLQQFAKSAQLSDTVTIQITNECPTLFQYNIGNMGRVQFYLAPKVEEMSA